MNDKTLADVREQALVSTSPLTLKQIREIAAEAFSNRANEHFSTLHQIEHEDDVESQPTAGTLLQPVVDALNAAGVSTRSTVGGVMKSLQIDFETLHVETCSCTNHDQISGSLAMQNFLNIADLPA